MNLTTAKSDHHTEMTASDEKIILKHFAREAKRPEPNDMAFRMWHKDLEADITASKMFYSLTTPELVAHVKECGGRAVKAAKQSLLHIGQTGLALIALKEKLGHGHFMREVEHRTGIHHRTANNYMKIAIQYGNVSNLKGVRDALQYIAGAAKEAGLAEVREFHAGVFPSPLTALYAKESRLSAPVIEAENVETNEAEAFTPAEQGRLAELEEVIDVALADIEDAALVIDGTRPEPPETKPETPNPWDISLQVIELLNQLEPNCGSPLGDILICLEKRFGIAFNRRKQKQ